MEEPLNCPSCGASLIAGRCLACDARRFSRFVHRELVLLLVIVGISVAAFFATRLVARGNEELRRRQAAAWFDAAQDALHRGSAEAAVAALRRAAVRDPSNSQYRLALAEALASSGQDDEARRALLALRDVQPEDAETNVQLARLEAHGTDVDATRRYYQNALAALWKPEEAARQSLVRTDLIEFLLAHGQRARALSELLVLAANLPPDAQVETRVGEMFLSAGDPARALDLFGRALRLDTGNARALAGAGESAFALADYRRALDYLNAAPRDDAHVAELRQLAQLVIAADPLAPRIGSSERDRRLSMALQQAMRRLDACLADVPADSVPADVRTLRVEAQTFRSTRLVPRRGDRRDVVADGVDLAFRVERALDQSCPTPRSPLDHALVLIGDRHGFDEQ